MGLSCHTAIDKIKGEVDFTFALAGNPNVGKSTLFNRLTGMGVMTANYPGKTVELNIATTDYDGSHIGIIDLPGTYAIGSVSEDQWVARQAVLDGQPDVVIVMVDATNLVRNLYIVLQFLDLGLPLVVALNLVDQAERVGLTTDVDRLALLLGVPVVETVATQGKGLDQLMAAALKVARRPRGRLAHSARYDLDTEKLISELEADIAATQNGFPYGLSSRALSILLLERDQEFIEAINGSETGRPLIHKAERLSAKLEEMHGKPSPVSLARERYGLAGVITSEAQLSERRTASLSERLWRYTTSPLSGLLILSAALVALFAFLFFVGTFLSDQFTYIWTLTASPFIDAIIKTIAGTGWVARTLDWGFDAGIMATLGVGIPYVLTFYFLLALLEDTGYLNSVAFLTDRLMHKFGLHGRAIIPLIAGAGCNVPAIIGTRVLTTERERVVASTLITMVPCSARTAVIIGALAFVGGWQPAAAVFAIVLLLIVAVGLALNRILPNQPGGLVMEMFPFRAPSLLSISKKTWYRFKHFITAAMPIVFVGSIVLGAAYETGYIWKLSAPMAPVIEGWLGLPAVAGLTLLFAVLRKELALQLLVTLAVVKYGPEAKNLLKFMTADQLFVYALVNTIYIPCVATIAILARELSWKKAISISGFTVMLAVFVGGLVTRLLAIV